jgi:hypothetical protein
MDDIIIGQCEICGRTGRVFSAPRSHEVIQHDRRSHHTTNIKIRICEQCCCADAEISDSFRERQK